MYDKKLNMIYLFLRRRRLVFSSSSLSLLLEMSFTGTGIDVDPPKVTAFPVEPASDEADGGITDEGV
jgi:hypothetical protein